MSEKNIDRGSWYYRLQNYVFSDEPKNSCEYTIAIVWATVGIVLLPPFAFGVGFLIGNTLRELIIVIISNLVITGIIIGGSICLLFIMVLFIYLKDHITLEQFCKKIKYFN